MYIVRALAFTGHGMQTGRRICEVMPQVQLERCSRGGLSAWTKESFEAADVIIYIGAVGIAVRAIAGHVKDKLHDPAVLVIDELGRYVIPILSGHVGGANEAAARLASGLGATAVITTATDINGRFAGDVWAKNSGLTILNKDGIKTVSSRILKGDPVMVYSQWPICGACPKGLAMTDDPEKAHMIIASLDMESGTEAHKELELDQKPEDGRGSDTSLQPEPEALRLAPKNIYLGIGCRRGISAEMIEEAWEQARQDHALIPQAIAGVATIDIKANEPGLLEFCRLHGWDLTTYDDKQLLAVPGQFHGSEFVKKTVGVDSVCERSAMLAARNMYAGLQKSGGSHEIQDQGSDLQAGDEARGHGAEMIVPKTARNGVTIAAALAEPMLSWT